MTASKAQWIVIPLILLSCCLTGAIMEPLIKFDKSSGSLMTMAMFALVSVVDLRSQIDWKTMRWRKNEIPMIYHLGLVFLFFSSSLIANIVFKFHVSPTLVCIFRSASMISTALLGFILGTRYPMRIVLGVAFATIGIIVCTLAEGQSQSEGAASETKEESAQRSQEWIFGIILLNLALVFQTLVGKLQEMTFKKFGKHTTESKFYSHFLSLPMFLFFWGDISNTIDVFNKTPLLQLDQIWMMDKVFDLIGPSFVSSFSLPIAWVYLLINITLQYGCITTVVWLLSISDSLTVQVTLTVRKFLSIMISIFYFQNLFTLHHWIGLILLSIGVYLYSFSSPSKPSPSPSASVSVSATETASTKKTQ